MFSTTPKTRTTVLSKHQRWLFLWQKTAALTKWFTCSTILNKLLLLDEAEQNIVICQWQAINYLPKYFVITEFNNSFIIWSPRLFFNEYSQAEKQSAIFMQEWSKEGEKHGFFYAWAEYYLQPNTVGWDCAWADHYLWAVICRTCGGPSTNEKKKHLLWMTILLQSYTTINECGISSTLISQY